MSDPTRYPPPPQEDDQDDDSMKERLAKFGLSPSDAFPDHVVVPQGRKLTLSTQGLKTLPKGYARLRPKTMDDVKRWIGVPDAVGKLQPCSCQPVSQVPFVPSPEAFKQLGQPEIKALSEIAYRYVYGDSAAVAGYLPAINNLLDQSLVVGCFLQGDIDVLPFSVLELGADLRVLSANHIRIWKHGRINLLGGAKIDCASITGDFTSIVSALVGSTTLLGAISILEETTHA